MACATTRATGSAAASRRRIIDRRKVHHRVRIIGGQLRGSILQVVTAPGLRPTPDRVRETLFNWITHWWDGDFASRQVLDLFAGSGALGLEAVSRGAARAVFVERDRQAAHSLREALTRLHVTNAELRQQEAMTALRTLPPQTFDLVLLDPPFDMTLSADFWRALTACLAPGALVYRESGAPIEVPAGLTALRTTQAGAVHAALLQAV